MTYAGSEGITVEALDGGGFQFSIRQRGRAYFRVVGPDDLITQMEAGALIGVNRATVFKWIRDGKLPYVPVEDQALVSLPHLREFAAAYNYPWEWHEGG